MSRKPKSKWSLLSSEVTALLGEFPIPLTYNEWSGLPELNENPAKPRPVNDDAVRDISFWLQRRSGLEWPKEKLWDGIIQKAKESPFNPLLVYLRSLQWNEENNIAKLLALIQPNDEELAYAYMVRWLISAVKRAFQPGCKADLMLVLCGPQGIGKSKLVRNLCPLPDRELFLEDFSARISREEKMKIRGKWIVELSELKGMREARLESLRSFLTTREDAYRVPWGKLPTVIPRGSVFIGTTNESKFLRDDTGERRFMVIESLTPDGQEWPEDRILVLRDQLWAHAVALEAAGEQSYLTAEESRAQVVHNALYQEEDPWTDTVLAGASRFPELVRPLEALIAAVDLGKRLDQCDQNDVRRVTGILRRGGWTNRVKREGNQVYRVWLRPR